MESCLYITVVQHNVVLKRAAKADVLARSTGDTFQLSNAFENTISEYEEKIRKLTSVV